MILRRFDVTVILRYFPEFEGELPRHATGGCLPGQCGPHERLPQGGLRAKMGTKGGGKTSKGLT
jgi:hypothetical protein